MSNSIERKKKKKNDENSPKNESYSHQSFEKIQVEHQKVSLLIQEIQGMNEAKNKRDSVRSFRTRTSILDISENTSINSSEFRGFFNLLAMALVWFFLITEGREMVLKGTLLGLERLIGLFNRTDLIPAWLLLISLSYGSVLIVKMMVWGIMRPESWSLTFLQWGYNFGVAILGGLIVFERDWPIVQSGFYLAEIAILFMKSHSFIQVNREAAILLNRKKSLEIQAKNLNFEIESTLLESSMRYPLSVTFSEFTFFLLIPTLVYEFNYPRTEKVRISYLIQKLVSGIGLFSVLHVLVETYIIPVVNQVHTMTTTEAISNLMLPFLMTYMLVFYFVFDVCCNSFAEMTRFADREFYLDWWNSTTFDEFARKWNVPVHHWLLRHVYLESIHSHHMSRNTATFLTFFLSSIVHELYMAMAFRTFSPLLFLMQMSQLPLIYLGRHPLFKGKRLGNCFFWLGMILGPPLISIIYTQESFMKDSFHTRIFSSYNFNVDMLLKTYSRNYTLLLTNWIFQEK